MLLSHLTSAPSLTRDEFLSRFVSLRLPNDSSSPLDLQASAKNSIGLQTLILVMEDVERKIIVGSGTLLLEKKFIHSGGSVGHLEDVVTHPLYRKTRLFPSQARIKFTSIKIRRPSSRTGHDPDADSNRSTIGML